LKRRCEELGPQAAQRHGSRRSRRATRPAFSRRMPAADPPAHPSTGAPHQAANSRLAAPADRQKQGTAPAVPARAAASPVADRASLRTTSGRPRQDFCFATRPAVCCESFEGAARYRVGRRAGARPGPDCAGRAPASVQEQQRSGDRSHPCDSTLRSARAAAANALLVSPEGSGDLIHPAPIVAIGPPLATRHASGVQSP
jgi:hypothetical protein